MTTLINLIGEQPIPNLLPVLFLKPDRTIMLFTDTTEKTANRIKKLVDYSELMKIDPYDINTGIRTIHKILNDNDDFIFNITGGTKIMSLAAYQVANERNYKFVYMQSEGKKNLLYSYLSSDRNNQKPMVEVMPELVNIDIYLRAHLPAYEQKGFHIDSQTKKLSRGGKFEKSIYSALDNDSFEVLAGFRPKGVGNQIEIDLAIRLKGTNNVGIAEIKTGDKEGHKKGLDQLVMATERDCLGTYTTRFLITSSHLSGQIIELAKVHHINVVDDLECNFNDETLSPQSKTRLIQKIKEKL